MRAAAGARDGWVWTLECFLLGKQPEGLKPASIPCMQLQLRLPGDNEEEGVGQLGATWHLKPEGRQAHVSERGPKPAQLISDPCSLPAKPRPPSTHSARSCPFSSCIWRAAWPCFVSRRRIAREKHATLFQRGAVGSGKRQIYPKHNTRPFAANQAQCCVVACCWLCSGFHPRIQGGASLKLTGACGPATPASNQAAHPSSSSN